MMLKSTLEPDPGYRYNKETEEHAMMNYDPVREKKYYVLTNAFKNRKKQTKKQPSINVIAEAYNLMFNSTDRFNSYLCNKYWPYHRWGWQSNYDELFFTGIAMNIYAIYHEIKKIPVENKLDWNQFSLKVAKAIFKHVKGL